MFMIIKTDKYDKYINNIIYYFYFLFQFAFVMSGSALARSTGKIYKVFTVFIIIPFLLLVLCDLYYFLRGRFNVKEIIIYSVVGIIMLISLYNYRNVMVIANLVIISVFKETDGKKALKYYCYAVAIAFVITILLGIFTPYQGNVTQYRHGAERIRYGLGFFYCSLGQFYFLSLVLAYLLIKEKLKLIEYAIFIVIDIILFYFTDTRAPFVYTIFALFLYWFINKFKDKCVYDLFGWLTVFSPAISMGTMYLMSKMFDASNVILSRINHIVNGRLYLTHNALEWFGVKIFGQTQPRVLSDSQCYLDSSTMVMLVLNGLFVSIVSIIFMSYFSYVSYKTKKVTILVVLFFIAFRGAFDLGFMAVQFSPVVVLFMPTLREYLKLEKVK